MGGLTRLIVFLSTLATMTLKSQAQYLLPITKHEPTKQFYTTLDIGSTEKSQHNFLLDLGTNLSWLNCHKLGSLSVLHIVACGSLSCTIIPGSVCSSGRYCDYWQTNPFGLDDVTGFVVQATASFSTTDGGKFLSPVSLDPFTFSCNDEKDLQGLAPPIAGVLSLSPGGNSSFTRQVASEFAVTPKFALCLPSDGTGHFYVAADYYIFPPFDNSTNLIPMTLTPLGSVGGNNTGDYVITVQAIYVEGIPLSSNQTNLLLGGVGAKLSTMVPYTTLQTDIYNALALAFTQMAETMGISNVTSVGPFKDCFDARTAGGKDMNMTGLNMPYIEFGLPGREGEVSWKFHVANTVVKVTETVICLAFQDGGETPEEIIVFGTHQLQDYMLEFDLSTTNFSFSESLLLHDTSCSTWASQK